MTATDTPRIAVLLVCHNRRELTLRALRSLQPGDDSFALVTVLFDDASTDGTAQAVRDAFPDAIVIEGDGAAFWNGGLHAAWAHARELGVDGYLWLNDDVALDADAPARLRAAWDALRARGQSEFILVGATRGVDGALSYGGMRRNRSPLALKLDVQPIAEDLEPIDTFNGNIVLISQPVVARIGINDPAYFHKFGDVDYGLTATAAGVPSYLVPGTLGVCERNPPLELEKLRFAARWKRVNSHHGLPFAGWWRLTRRHSGIWVLPHFLSAYRRLLFPRKKRT